jgi:hypothetical protein
MGWAALVLLLISLAFIIVGGWVLFGFLFFYQLQLFSPKKKKEELDTKSHTCPDCGQIFTHKQKKCEVCGTSDKTPEFFVTNSATTSSYNHTFQLVKGNILDRENKNIVKFKSSRSGFGSHNINTNIGKVETNKSTGSNNFIIETKKKQVIGSIEMLNVDHINLIIGSHQFTNVNLLQNPLELSNKNISVCSANFFEGTIQINHNNVDVINGILLFLYFFNNNWMGYVTSSDYEKRNEVISENLLFSVEGPKGIDSIVTFYDKTRNKYASIEDNEVGGNVLVLILSIIAIEIVIGFVINYSLYLTFVILFDIVLFIILIVVGSKISKSIGKQIKSSYEEILGIVKDDQISGPSLTWDTSIFHDQVQISKLIRYDNGNGTIRGSFGNYLIRFGRIITDADGNKIFYISGYNKSYRIFAYQKIDPVFICGLSFLLINKYLMPKATGGGGG